MEQELFKWLARRLSHALTPHEKVLLLYDTLFQNPAPFSGATRPSADRALDAFTQLGHAVFNTTPHFHRTLNDYLVLHLEELDPILCDAIKNKYRCQAFDALSAHWQQSALAVMFSCWMSYGRFDAMRFSLLYEADPDTGRQKPIVVPTSLFVSLSW